MSWLTTAFATVNAVAVLRAPNSARRITAMVALAVEASALALATLAYVTLAIIGDAEHRASLLGLAALSALSALGLGAATRGVARSKRWALGPSITWQVLQGFVGAYVLSTGNVLLGLSLLVLAVPAGLALIAIARSVDESRS